MSIRFPTRAPLTALLLASATLAACGGGSADTAGSVTTAGDGAWRITPDGFGPLKAGQSVAEAATAVGSAFAVAATANPECSYAEWGAAPPGVRVMLVRDTVVRVEVTQANVATAGGARVGDNEGRINSMYAGKVFIRPHKYTTGKYLIVVPPEDTLHHMVFETDGQKVTEFRSGRMPEVEWVERCG
jgi:hypothetical protein